MATPRFTQYPLRDLRLPERLQDASVLDAGEHRQPRPQHDEGNPDPQGETPAKGLVVALEDDVQEWPEPLDDEAAAHQGHGRTVPCQQGALGGKEHAGVVEVGHGADWTRTCPESTSIGSGGEPAKAAGSA